MVLFCNVDFTDTFVLVRTFDVGLHVHVFQERSVFKDGAAVEVDPAEFVALDLVLLNVFEQIRAEDGGLFAEVFEHVFVEAACDGEGALEGGFPEVHLHFGEGFGDDKAEFLQLLFVLLLSLDLSDHEFKWVVGHGMHESV